MGTRITGLLAILLLWFVLAGAAHAALMHENFDGMPVAPGPPPGWFECDVFKGPTWEIADVGGNHVLRGVSGLDSVGGSDGKTGPESATGWFVENCDVQVSMCILSGSGGGIGIGQVEGAAYVGNSYYVEASVPLQAVALCVEGLSLTPPPLAIINRPINYGEWYDLRLKSTGTTFEVYFRPHSTSGWLETDKVIDVPHDLPYPGHKAYVEGWVACWTQNDNTGEAQRSTVLFDDFSLDAAPFPAPVTFSDDFESESATLAHATPYMCTPTFEYLGGSQAIRLTSTDDVTGLFIGQAQQYYTHQFTLRTSLCVDEDFCGGVAWGVELTQAPTYSDYFVAARLFPEFLRVQLIEEINNVHSLLGTALLPPTAGWYTLEVQADYRYYRVWWWPRGDPKPATPLFEVAQDALHPGYRAILRGGAGIWQDSPFDGHTFWSGAFDDLYFHGTPVPSTNTPAGSDVVVTPPEAPDLTLSFDTVSEGGTTTVETSTTAPGGGAGGFQFQGTYYDINTTAVFSGPVQISLCYDDSGMTPAEEANLRLLHWLTAEQRWEDITTSVDTTLNVVHGETASFSVFALATRPSVQGFLEPVNMPPAAMSVFKQKSTIPFKFRLLDPATGLPVGTAQATIRGVRVSGDTAGTVNEPFVSAQADAGTAFRYDEAEGLYIYNLSTKNLAPGVYRVTADIAGGLIQLSVDVKLK